MAYIKEIKMSSPKVELNRISSVDGLIPVEELSEAPKNVVRARVPCLVGVKTVTLTKSELAAVQAGIPPERLFYL